MSQKIGLGQLRNSAAHYFDRVAAGESFDVVRRGRLIAQIIPVGAEQQGEAAAAQLDPGLIDVDRRSVRALGLWRTLPMHDL